MSTITFDLATPDDDAALRHLLGDNPMPGAISLSFEREPCYFRAAAIEGDFHQTLVARANGNGPLVGMVSRSVRQMFVNGAVQPVGYMNQLRIAPAYGRGLYLARGVSQAFAFFQTLHSDGRAPFYFTSIIADNLSARRLFAARLPYFPTMREYARLNTYAIYLGRRKRPLSLPRGLRFARGSAADVSAIVDCLQRNGARHQLAPYWSSDNLCNPTHTPDLSPADFFLALDGARVVGCLARWDQRHFKQTVVRGYAGVFGRWRPLLNFAARFGGWPSLPPPNTALRYCYASHLAIDDDDPAVCAALLRAFYNDSCRGGSATQAYDYFTLGLSEAHPLNAVVRRSYRHVVYQSQIYLAAWDDGLPQLARIDGRVPGLEIAVL